MILEHYESFLGTMVRAWKSPNAPQVSVAEFSSDGCTFLGTVGLSLYKKVSPSGRETRQELLMMWRGAVPAADVAPVLLCLCRRVIENAALLRGELVDLGSPICSGLDKRYLLATVPAFLPQDFSVCRLGQGDLAIFCWMLPLSSSEASFVRSFGWDRFEGHLEGMSSGILDVDRDEIVVEQ